MSTQASRRSRVAVPLERSMPQRLAPHPAARPVQSWRRRTRTSDRPLAVDLFCGCGGLSLGLERAGYDVFLSIDHDPCALASYRGNLPGRALDWDLSDPDNIDKVVRLLDDVPVELVAGGPPCQPFSRAGRSKIRSLVAEGIRPADDERSFLWQSFLKIVERVAPTAVLLENVPDMALGDELTILRIMIEHLERLGYDVESQLVDAWRFGVPQHRQRLFLLARNDGRPITWPAGQPRVTLRDAIGDLPPLEGPAGEPEVRYRVPRKLSAFQLRARENMEPVLWDHVTRRVRDDDLEAFQLMKPGMRYADLPERLRRYRADIFDDKYNRLDWNELSRSITAHIAKDGYWYIHPQEHRTLTVREAARIQTFPDRFRYSGTRSDAFRQIGNAVPPALGEAIGCALMNGAKARVLPQSRRLGSRHAAIRARLLTWGREDAKHAPWRHPGDPWQVLAGVILADRVGSSDRAVEEFLRCFPAAGKGVATKIRKAAALRKGTESKGYRRLSGAVAELTKGGAEAWNRERWARAAKLGPTSKDLVRTIGLKEDRILSTAPLLRVVARLTGTSVDEKRQLSDGRMQTARIVGAAEVPGLTAALHALGRSICGIGKPDCWKCPLRRQCRTAS